MLIVRRQLSRKLLQLNSRNSKQQNNSNHMHFPTNTSVYLKFKSPFSKLKSKLNQAWKSSKARKKAKFDREAMDFSPNTVAIDRVNT